MGFSLSSQTYKIQGNNIICMQKVDKLTSFTYQDKDGTIYPVYINSKGKFYIKKISKKTGKEYRYYLPKEIQEQLNQLYN